MSLSKRLRGQLSGSGGRYHPALTNADSTDVEQHREGFTPRSVSRRPKCGSPAPAKRMLKVSSAVTGLGEPRQELHPVGWSAPNVHMEHSIVTFRSRPDQELSKNRPAGCWSKVSTTPATAAYRRTRALRHPAATR